MPLIEANPALDRSWCITQITCRHRAAHSLGDEEQRVQAVVVPGFLGAIDLLANGHNDGGFPFFPFAHLSIINAVRKKRNDL